MIVPQFESHDKLFSSFFVLQNEEIFVAIWLDRAVIIVIELEVVVFDGLRDSDANLVHLVAQLRLVDL